MAAVSDPWRHGRRFGGRDRQERSRTALCAAASIAATINPANRTGGDLTETRDPGHDRAHLHTSLSGPGGGDAAITGVTDARGA